MDGKNRVKNHGMGYSNNAAKNKNKQKDSNAVGGKVTQFKNIDDIPNITEDDIQWSDQPNDVNNSNMAQQQQFSALQYYPSSGYNSNPTYAMSNSYNSVSSSGSMKQSHYSNNSYSHQHHQQQPDYYSASQQSNENEYQKDYNSNMWPQQHRHDDLRNRQIQEEIEEAELEEDVQDDDSSDGDNPLPVPPHKGGNKISAEDDGYRGNNNGDRKGVAKQGNSKQNNINMAAPPLPYDIKKNAEKKLTGKEKLFFSKEPRAVEFKPYTLGQYNLIKPKEYMEISNIKPDLNTEELIAKRANLDRVKEFAKNLHNFNHEHLRNQKKLPPSNEKSEMEIAHKKLESKRQKAIDFAKNIPKPKIPAAKDAYGKQRGDDEESAGMSNFDMGEGYEEELKLQELEAKHVNSKRQIEAIRKAMGMN